MRPIAFDAQWRAVGVLADCASLLHRDVLGLEAVHAPRKRRRRPADATAFALEVERLLCNVAAVELVAKGRSLATPRDRKRSCRGVAGAALIDVLEAGGLLSHLPGGWNHGARRRDISVSTPAPAMRANLPAKLDAGHLGRAAGAVLELRTRKDAEGVAHKLPLPDTKETQRLSAEMEALNAFLARAPIERADGRRLWLHEPADRLPRVVSAHATHLRRVFNNGTLEHGGRLVGGWWLSMSKAERAGTIRMDGERVCELDFTAMVPRLCYALRGVPWPFGDDRDAPYIAGPQASREAWKRWTNAMLFAGSLPRSWLGKSIDARRQFAAQFGGLGWGEARALVLKHHAALHASGGFGCELGMEAMHAESDIAVDVGLRLAARGITCLPIHDGFAVAAGKADEAADVMGDAAEARVGIRLAVALK